MAYKDILTGSLHPVPLLSPRRHQEFRYAGRDYQDALTDIGNISRAAEQAAALYEAPRFIEALKDLRKGVGITWLDEMITESTLDSTPLYSQAIELERILPKDILRLQPKIAKLHQELEPLKVPGRLPQATLERLTHDVETIDTIFRAGTAKFQGITSETPKR